ncbi:spondin domain-containing protein [Deinococcus sp. SM5_A1]|uniref:spondin domain-containing protein n=1 Tax=Deinococcus sp. SM5_A1 TaxID=3379094 RepID=UPI00385B76A3
MKNILLFSSVALTLAACAPARTPANMSQTFKVRVQNVSTPATLATPGGPGAAVPVPLSPVVWAVHSAGNPIWTLGTKASAGLEGVAEDGSPMTLAGELKGKARSSGVASIPVGASAPGPLLPGDAYEFTLSAVPGDRLSFATMFVQSNDLFYDFSGAGLNLFGADGKPVSGDATAGVVLLDAGTEVNEQPGVGPAQKPRQPSDNFGPSENGVVHLVNDGYVYPAASSVIQVTVTPAQ